MAETRTSVNKGLGLYATKVYQPGDIILEESALFTFQPRTKEQLSAIQSQFKTTNSNASTNDKIAASASSASLKGTKEDTDMDPNQLFLQKLTPTIPSSVDAHKHPKFMGMVTAAAAYAISTTIIKSTTKDKLMALYKPSESSKNKHELEIIELARSVITFLQENTKPATPLYTLAHEREEECCAMILIWSCNAFKGGHVYEKISRINHSCDFNAVISLPSSNDNGNGKINDDNIADEKQFVKAASIIQPGDEIHISYLGSYTYAGMAHRKQVLCADKYFDCQCERCTKEKMNGE